MMDPCYAASNAGSRIRVVSHCDRRLENSLATALLGRPARRSEAIRDVAAARRRAFVFWSYVLLEFLSFVRPIGEFISDCSNCTSIGFLDLQEDVSCP